MTAPTTFPNTPVLDVFVDPSNPQALQTYDPAHWSRIRSIISNSHQTTAVGSAANVGGPLGCGNGWFPVYGLDTECYFTITALPGGAGSLRAWVRTQDFYEPSTAQASLKAGYYFSVDAGSSTWTLVAHYPAAGFNLVTLATGSQAIGVGDAMGCSVVGSVVSGWYKTAAGAWTLVTSVTDGTVTGMGNIAVQTLTANSVAFTSFGGGVTPGGYGDSLAARSVSPPLGM